MSPYLIVGIIAMLGILAVVVVVFHLNVKDFIPGGGDDPGGGPPTPGGGGTCDANYSICGTSGCCPDGQCLGDGETCCGASSKPCEQRSKCCAKDKCASGDATDNCCAGQEIACGKDCCLLEYCAKNPGGTPRCCKNGQKDCGGTCCDPASCASGNKCCQKGEVVVGGECSLSCAGFACGAGSTCASWKNVSKNLAAGMKLCNDSLTENCIVTLTDSQASTPTDPRVDIAACAPKNTCAYDASQNAINVPAKLQGVTVAPAYSLDKEFGVAPDCYLDATSQKQVCIADFLQATATKTADFSSLKTQVEAQFDNESSFGYSMRNRINSPFGYVCLGGKQTANNWTLLVPETKSCSALDCLKVSQEEGNVTRSWYDDKSQACVFEKCFGDGCPAKVEIAASPSQPSLVKTAGPASGVVATCTQDAAADCHGGGEGTYDCITHDIGPKNTGGRQLWGKGTDKMSIKVEDDFDWGGGFSQNNLWVVWPSESPHSSQQWQGDICTKNGEKIFDAGDLHGYNESKPGTLDGALRWWSDQSYAQLCVKDGNRLKVVNGAAAGLQKPPGAKKAENDYSSDLGTFTIDHCDPCIGDCWDNCHGAHT